MTICRHFGTCGGCSYQDLPLDAYRALKRSMVVDALGRHGFACADVHDTVEVPPNSRRRATFKIARHGGEVLVGFHAAHSHDIVDMQECLVIASKLFAFVSGLRKIMGEILHDGESAEVHATDSDGGTDVAIEWRRKISPAITAQIAGWAAKLKLARVTANGHRLAEYATPSVQFGKARVQFPPESFLQPTREGEDALLAKVRAALAKAKNIADLFSGCGTFTLPLAERSRVHAVELNRAALAALEAASRATQGLKPVSTEARDLFKTPLSGAELTPFDAVLLDPPRVGALAQIRALAASSVPRIAYVSCNAESFARDARILVNSGYRMGAVTPVDQFLWSSHIELVAAFARS